MAEQSFSRPLICIDERNQAYKSLIQDIAERLGEKDVNSIVYQRSLPEPARPQTGLDLLSQLDRAGLFSPSNIDPLIDLLKKIHRYDLVSQFIDGYLQHYGTGNTSGQEISPGNGRAEQPLLRYRDTCSLTQLAIGEWVCHDESGH